MVTKPAPVDTGLTVHRGSTVQRLTEYNVRLLQSIDSSSRDERAYADLLAANIERVGARTCWIIRTAINPSEQEDILALASPWLHEIRDRLESRARTRQNPNGSTETVAEWIFGDDYLTKLMKRGDEIVAKATHIDE